MAELRNVIQQKREEAAKAETSAVQQLQVFNDAFTSSLKAQRAAVDQLTKKRDTHTETGVQAFGKIKEASLLPPKVAKLFGIFDRDYNITYQQQTMSEAQLKAAQAEQRIADRRAAGESERSLFSRNADTALKLFEITAKAEANAEQNFTMDNAERRATIEETREAERWKAEKQGLERSQQISALSAMDENSLADELAKAQEAVANGQKPKFDPGILQDVIRNTEDSKVALASARNALAVGDIQLESLSKKRFLSAQGPAKLLNLAEEAAKNNGVIEKDGVTFTARELQLAHTAAVQADAESRKKIAENVALEGNIQGNMKASQSIAERVSRLNGGTLTPEMQATINTAVSNIGVTKGVSLPVAESKSKALFEYMSAESDKIAKNFSKAAQPAAKQYLDSGNVTSQDAANGFIGENFQASSPIPEGSVFAAAGAELSMQLQKAVSSQNFMELSLGNKNEKLSIPTGKSKATELAAKMVVENPKLRAVTAGAIHVRHLGNTLQKLAAENDAAFSGIVDENGVVSYKYRDQDGKIVMANIFAELRRREQAMTRNSPDGREVSLLDTFLTTYSNLDNINRTTGSIQNAWTLEEAALGKVLFNNELSSPIRLNASLMQQQMPQLIQATESNAVKIDNNTEFTAKQINNVLANTPPSQLKNYKVMFEALSQDPGIDKKKFMGLIKDKGKFLEVAPNFINQIEGNSDEVVGNPNTL
jgi:hypothetical protein